MPETVERDLIAIVADDNFIVDAKQRSLLSHDVFYRPDVIAEAVIAPSSTEELAGVVAVLNKAGIDMHVRGGGMSYTDAYTPTDTGSVLIDMRRMNRIIEVNEEDMYVTLETGCTWAELNAALESKNLRTPFWGPLSGLISTIGGGLSQNNAFFGGSTWGTTSESLIALKVVIADGTVVETGSASTRNGKPYYRFYGPDLTGIFTGDAGAMGIKAEATFRLIRRPAKSGFASFAFSTHEASAAAMSEMSREGLGAELFGFDPGLTAMAMSRGTWSDNVKTVKDLVKAEGSALAGMKQAAKTAIAGKSIMHRGDFSLHVICDGRSTASINADLESVREIATRHDAKEIDNSVAKVVRAAPFGPVDSMVGPNGERWVPTHGIVAHSDGPKIWTAMIDLFEEHADALQEHEISWGFLTCTLATNGFLIEPVMIWPDELYPMHRHYVREDHLAGIPAFDANPAAREFVTDLRRKLVDIFSDFKAVHFQIGKAYPYREHRKASTWALVEAIKSHIDPDARLNPGCLGLDTGKAE
jgi:FAD/FMN-containing dehydrogenase